jgi:hypothetical protein
MTYDYDYYDHDEYDLLADARAEAREEAADAAWEAAYGDEFPVDAGTWATQLGIGEDQLEAFLAKHMTQGEGGDYWYYRLGEGAAAITERYFLPNEDDYEYPLNLDECAPWVRELLAAHAKYLSTGVGE